MRLHIYCVLALSSACGMGGGSSGDNTGPQTSADAGGGGVSFGGQQDIGEFRGILKAGGIPGADTLDANGFFNEHYAPPPQTGCTDALCLTPGVSVGKDWLHGQHQATLQVAINTNVDPTNYPKQPLNLVIVVDHSGSMAQDGRLEKVKSGLNTLIDSLDDTDRLALVEFDDRVQTDAPFGATLDRAALHTIVNGLTPRGATDIYSGLSTGFNLSQGALASNRQNRVIFLSDGNATAGITDQAAIIAMADGFVEQGIGLTTIGVGQDFDVKLMRGLAEHGAGNFYFLEDASAATEVFKQELAFFVSPLALDININAVAGPGYNFGEVLGSTLWNASTKAGSMHIPAAFVASRTGPAPDPGTGGRRGGGSMLFIHLDPIAGNNGKVADLTLTYHLPGSAQVVSQHITLDYAMDPQETPETPYLSAPEMANRYAMYNMFLGFRAAVTNPNYNCGTVALRELRASASAWNATKEDPDISADLTLLDLYITNLSTHGATVGPEATEQSCQGYGTGGGYDGGGWNEGEGNDYHHSYACNAGGSPSGALVIGLGFLVAMRRRNRR